MGGWEYAAATGALDAFFWSRPSAVAETIVVSFHDGNALTDAWYTARATLLSFISGTASGTAWGLSFWCLPAARQEG